MVLIHLDVVLIYVVNKSNIADNLPGWALFSPLSSKVSSPPDDEIRVINDDSLSVAPCIKTLNASSNLPFEYRYLGDSCTDL